MSETLDPLSRALVTTQDEIGKLRAKIALQAREILVLREEAEAMTQDLQTGRELVSLYLLLEDALGVEQFVDGRDAVRSALVNMVKDYACYQYVVTPSDTVQTFFSAQNHENGFVDQTLAAAFRALGWNDPCRVEDAK